MRKSFTIIELLISISIMTIISIYLFSSLDVAKKSNNVLRGELFKKSAKDRLYKLIFEDIFKSSKSSVKRLEDRDYNILTLKSSNSAFGIINPYITYFVSRDKILYRVESINEINASSLSSGENRFKIDEILKDVEIFNIHKSGRNLFAYIKAKGGSIDEIMLEVVRN